MPKRIDNFNTCVVCLQPFRVANWNKHQKCCTKLCADIYKKGRKRKGKPSNRKGKKYEEIFGVKRAEEVRQKHRKCVEFICPVCGKLEYLAPCIIKIRKTCSNICKYKYLDRNKRISDVRKGKTIDQLYGQERANKIRKKQSISQINYSSKPGVFERRSIAAKERYKDDAYRMRILKSQGGTPNKSDKVLIDYINENSLPFRFTGNRKFWIEKFNPDFVNTNHQKVVIEKEGCYFHGCSCCYPYNIRTDKMIKLMGGVRKHDILRDQTYSKYGWKIIKIWEHELKDGSFKDKLKEYLGATL